MKKKSFARFIADNFRLQGEDFAWCPLIVAGIWAAFAVLFAVLYFFIRDEEILTLGVPSIIVLAMVVVLGVVWSLSRIWLEFRVGVQMGQTRRRMLAAEMLLSLATTAETLLLVFPLNAVWKLAAQAMLPGAELEDPLTFIPLVGWAALLLLPTLLGSFFGALVLRFGSRAGWTIYLLFMLTCVSPSVLEKRLEANAALKETVLALWAALVPWLPVLLAAAAAALLAGTWAMLRKISIV